MARAILQISPGHTFGQWTVIRYTGTVKNNRSIHWFCRCSCGAERNIRSDHIRHVKWTRCHRCAVTKHGCSTRARTTPAYRSWKAMIQRCTNPNHQEYPTYGGRGIVVCERWRSFTNFLADMGERPTVKHELDRIEVDGHYAPDNCRWATRGEQCRNMRRNVSLTFNGETLVITDWATRLGLPVGTLQSRFRKGWNVKDILTTPVFTLFRHRDRQQSAAYQPLQVADLAIDISHLEEIPNDPPAFQPSTANNVRHGMYKSVEYRTYMHMKDRCLNPRCKAYPDYGGRGIMICKQWLESFQSFYADMGPRPSPNHELDRIDNSEGYSPGNCRWAIRAQQLRNTRRTHLITYQGVTMALIDWANILGMSYMTLGARINNYGWTIERALSVPPQRRNGKGREPSVLRQ